MDAPLLVELDDRRSMLRELVAVEVVSTRVTRRPLTLSVGGLTLHR